MPSFINSHEGNTFSNYMTPLVKGESGQGSWNNITNWSNVFTAKFGSSGTYWAFESASNLIGGGSGYDNVFWFRPPAPGLESKTGSVIGNGGRFNFSTTFSYNVTMQIGTGNTNNGSNIVYGGARSIAGTDIGFTVVNDYSLIHVCFNSSFAVVQFNYMGWLREPSYIGSVAPRGLVGLTPFFAQYERATTENSNSKTLLSVDSNSITNPPITCSVSTPGANVTDIVIRDRISPNNAIGKLYNCVGLPGTANPGEIWKNTGVDPETGLPYTSDNVNKYLATIPWGGRRLGVRIWTEGYA